MMAIYWRLESVPEMEGLDFRQRFDMYDESVKRAKRESWKLWVLYSFVPTWMFLWIYGGVYLLLEEQLIRVFVGVWDGFPSLRVDDIFIFVATIMTIFLPATVTEFALLRPIRLRVGRRYMREFLAGG